MLAVGLRLDQLDVAPDLKTRGIGDMLQGTFMQTTMRFVTGAHRSIAENRAHLGSQRPKKTMETAAPPLGRARGPGWTHRTS